jgi:hypothetical protein
VSAQLGIDWDRDVSLPVSGRTPEAKHAGSTGAQRAAKTRGALALSYRRLLIESGPKSDDEAATLLGVLPRSICSTRNAWVEVGHVAPSGDFERTAFGTKRVRWQWVDK